MERGDGGMNRSREVDRWVIGVRGGARDGKMYRDGWVDGERWKEGRTYFI